MALVAVFCLGTQLTVAQSEKAEDARLKIYRATPEKINNLVHTKLQVRFDYAKRYLYGKAWITIKPHFYPVDSLRLDAKGMVLNEVSLIAGGKTYPLKYAYDGMQIKAKLPRTYKSGESYVVFVDYVAKPDEMKAEGSAAITGAKGLYFINPDGADKDKPIQVWTQGETEASSVWFPTIDRPNQKTTSEIAMTVPDKYVTLSNGKLVSQKKNIDGTRVDTWKMDLPHSPYLFMMAVGDFKIYKDKWRDKEVNYYLEPAYAPYAKQIFGRTPQMMEFFSQKLGVDYPWNKYSQIVVRDYVSGAMENTTATLHGDFVQMTDRELLDGDQDFIIAHELFHQWFGDYVTTESWSNLTVNESFADFSEMLWAEHFKGKDAGDEHSREAMQAYFGDGPKGIAKDLVRFHYRDKEEMFDHVTYKKGGRILNMLRNFLGEDAFFKGLQLYLKQNAFKNGEAHQLRLAMEEVSGKDLNWFFNQWYFGNGHPILDISHIWDAAKGEQKIVIIQKQAGKAFELPFAVDIYYQGKKDRHMVWVKNKRDTLTFKVPVKPDWVNVDGDKVLLAQKIDHKGISEYAFQYKNGPLYQDRFESIDVCADRQTRDPEALGVLLAALSDKYEGLRISAIHALEVGNDDVKRAALPKLKALAMSDSVYKVRAEALSVLVGYEDVSLLPLFKDALKSRSYAVQAAGLLGSALLDPKTAMAEAKTLQVDSRGELNKAITMVYAKYGTISEFPYVDSVFQSGGVQKKAEILPVYLAILARINSSELVLPKLEAIAEVAVVYKNFNAEGVMISMLEQFRQAKQQHLMGASVADKDQITAQIVKVDELLKILK